MAAVAAKGIHLVGTLEFEAPAAQTEAAFLKDGLCWKVYRWDKEGQDEVYHFQHPGFGL